MVDTILLVKATERNGRATCDFIVLETITFFNLHRCLQFCFKPRQSDSTIDGKAFNFVCASTSKAIKAAKTAQLFSLNGRSEAAIGDAFTYEADGKQYRVEMVDKHRADGRQYVPRCIAGSNGAGAPPVDLDATNGKLLVRRFSKRGVGQIKKPPAVLAHVDDTNAQLWRRQMNTMRLGMRWHEEWLAEMRSPAGQEEMRQQLQESMMASAQSDEERQRIRSMFSAAGRQQQQQQQQENDAASAAAAAGSDAGGGHDAAAAAGTPAAATPLAAAAAAADAAEVGEAAATVLALPAARGVPAASSQTTAAGSGQQASSAAAAATAAAALVADTPQAKTAAAGKPAAASKPTKAAAGNNSILKYFAKQPKQAQ